MKKYGHKMLTILVILSQVCSGLALETTGPAFMWSPHINMELADKVNYQTLSSRDLARSVMSTGGWSNILCEGKESHQPVDIAVVFVGKELKSSGITGNSLADASLVDLLKDSFTKSNFSMAYPYVSARITEETLENSLIREFEESCGRKFGVGNIIVTESCLIEDKGYSKLADMQAVEEYVSSSVEKGVKEQTDLLVVCRGGFSSLQELDQPRSEGAFFSELITSLDLSGAKYSVLYVSDPYNPIQYRQMGRLLAEGHGNASLNSTVFCDGVCQIKKTLLEAVFVAIVLLIILISGLCCMMGIDTPTRFEAPQES
ncbi:hypothetical protein BVRB_2g027560 [Beta vulgaris subsp. vulgaris]|uniref:uncharacterized protein LOC104906613 n=1 Tax=Beta vulgaris subsp. vulgaris TaxID=3555 RepID=UPI00053FDA63|nr:uncharacterized protein LOC104906613 [Beta vulgaris subsp. vulgaris]XP_010693702.1 uncharacterized protein LOC104906613 [Beta vulgaris subsp. vulgaris]KMT18626.1 hypothetical protein BVRB_2g027560 [Beta vulgaris subsp. vulgaris]